MAMILGDTVDERIRLLAQDRGRHGVRISNDDIVLVARHDARRGQIAKWAIQFGSDQTVDERRFTMRMTASHAMSCRLSMAQN
ncbi:MAG: hypothetical protein ACOVPA_17820 [Rubrivivax sp.]